MTPEGRVDPGLLLLDLDGTLADTFPDLRWALDTALAEHDLPPAEPARLRACVSLGARAMTTAAVGTRGGPVERVLDRFLQLYRENIAVRTRLFDGMAQVMDRARDSGVAVGVVTNKREVFTTPLLRHLGLDRRLCCVVSGDTVARAKPHPDPLLHAADLAGVSKARCAYVGDSRNDIVASRAAGMPVAAACWGYLPADDDPALWQADAMLACPLDLIRWLDLEA